MLFYEAYKTGDLTMLKLFPTFLETEDIDGWRPIHYACYHNQINVVKFLISKNVDLMCETTNKQTPLHIACKNNNIDTVKLLIDGFVHNRMYTTASKVKLLCLDNENKFPSDLTDNLELREFISGKLKILNQNSLC